MQQLLTKGCFPAVSLYVVVVDMAIEKCFRDEFGGITKDTFLYLVTLKLLGTCKS